MVRKFKQLYSSNVLTFKVEVGEFFLQVDNGSRWKACAWRNWIEVLEYCLNHNYKEIEKQNQTEVEILDSIKENFINGV